MIAHVILFRPKADLAAGEREAFFDAMRAAHRQIPQIRRFVVGSRIVKGRPYDALARDFPFFALLEFDSAADLDAYLTHPAHAELGDRFYRTSEAAEAYDFALRDVE
ncbi:MAG: Dabb family protein [Vicinamibacterales bacterium]